MDDQIAVQQLLQRKLTEIQSSRPAYSLRAFAQKVGVHVGALSSIINGKRRISRDLARRIAERLLLDPQERSELLKLFPEPVKRLNKKGRINIDGDDSSSVQQSRYLAISAAQFRIIAEWEHFAILSLLNCADFKSETSWIAARLGISLTRTSQVIDRLIQVGILKLDADGRLSRNPKSYRTQDDQMDYSIQKAHLETLDLARESIIRDSVALRDFTSVTMAIDPKKLSAAKELIRKQEDELSDLLESGKRTEVYRLSVQLFPLTRFEKGE